MIILRGGLGTRPSSDDGGGESEERDELSAALMMIFVACEVSYHWVLGRRFKVRDGDYREINFNRSNVTEFHLPFSLTSAAISAQQELQVHI